MNPKVFTNLRFTSLILLFFLFLNGNIQAQKALDIALNHFDTQKEKFELTTDDIQNYRVSDLYSSRHNGVTHVYLQQQYQDINLVNAISNFNVLPNGKVVSMGNRFVANLASKVNTTEPQITPLDAVESMISYFDITTNGELELDREVGKHHFIFKNEGIALEPVNVKLMFQPINDDKEVRLVWQVDLYELDGQNWQVASVDALTGEVLFNYNQVVSCDFTPKEEGEKCTDHTHYHPVTQQENTQTLVMDENVYNVYPIPLESPNHGDQQIIIDPADPIASPYGWHDIDGQDGHEYTITRGNNVHAYHDIFALNQSIGDEPDGGDTLVFDIPFDENNFQVFAQRDAATVNLFYWNNIIHDLWYQYGFDEASGNFQENNYGNGGQGGDYVFAECLDGSGTNNANFGTPADGGNGRMQMYFWGGGQTATPPTIDLNVLQPATVAGTYPMSKANFGADLPDTLTSEVILVNDAEGDPADACETIVNGAEIAGKIAMINRGTCGHGGKANRAQNAGAIAIIFCNNENEDYSPNGGNQGQNVNIPVIALSQQTCNTIKVGLADGLVVQIIDQDLVYTVPDPGPTGRDGDWDNGIIVHEYGHGISNRLTGGPNQAGCLSGFEQMGEGWSDWLALAMQTTPDNTATEVRGIGTYATGEPTTGAGIRNFPYSRDLAVNPQTYMDVISTNVPHGVGEIWAVILWDLYWNFIDIYGFDEDYYTGTGGNNMVMQLVIDGMKFQPCNPDFVEGRDAILAADEALFGGEHQCLIWETFARRGVGYSAFSGGVEAFDEPPFCNPVLKIAKEAQVVVDAGDVIAYTLTIRNDTPEFLEEATIEDFLPANATFVAGSSSCGGSVDAGVLTIPLTDFASGEQRVCTYQLQTPSQVLMSIEFEDDVEGTTSIWSKTANVGTKIWLPSNLQPNSGTRSWKAGNPDTPSDQWLTLKEGILIDGTKPALTFWHAYRTEAGFDGGVVELSTDDGDTWENLEPYFIFNGYNDQLATDPTNILSGQNAFTGNSNGLIQSVADLTAFNGETVRVRFRFATNDGGEVDGWYVDDIILYSDLEVVLNEACLSDNAQDMACNTSGTIVLGTAVNTTEILPQSSVRLFPNPTTGNIILEWSDELTELASVSLFNLDGREISNWSVDSNQNNLSLNIAEFGTGVFMIRIMSNNQLITKKVVVK